MSVSPGSGGPYRGSDRCDNTLRSRSAATRTIRERHPFAYQDRGIAIQSRYAGCLHRWTPSIGRREPWCRVPKVPSTASSRPADFKMATGRRRNLPVLPTGRRQRTVKKSDHHPPQAGATSAAVTGLYRPPASCRGKPHPERSSVMSYESTGWLLAARCCGCDGHPRLPRHVDLRLKYWPTETETRAPTMVRNCA